MKKRIYQLLLLLGIILMGINLSGEFLSLRGSTLEQDFPGRIKLTPKQVLAVANEPIANRGRYLEQLTVAVHQGMIHCWKDSDIDKYHMRVPIYENYLLFGASYIAPIVFGHRKGSVIEKWEFTNPRKALERGVGLCSQYSMVLAVLLTDKGIPAKIIGLNGHVVVAAAADKKGNHWWVLDADYGVIIPHDIIKIEENPSIIRSYYAAKGIPTKTINKLVRIYGKEGNIIPNETGYYYHKRRLILAENLAYFLKWAIPLGLALPFSLFWLKRRKSL